MNSEIYKTMFKDYPDVLEVKQIQEMLKIGRHQAYSLIISGKIYGIKVGKAYKIPKVKLIEFLIGEKAS